MKLTPKFLAAAALLAAAQFPALAFAKEPQQRFSVAELDRLADRVGKGTLGVEQSMRADFARAEHALALEHRAKAAVSDARALGDKLASGAQWSRDEVATGMKKAGSAIAALGRQIASRG